MSNPGTHLNLETLEFVIYPDGRVKEMVTGIVGASCQEVTAAIEAQLGHVMSQSVTADYYVPVENQTHYQSANYGDW